MLAAARLMLTLLLADWDKSQTDNRSAEECKADGFMKQEGSEACYETRTHFA